MLGEKRYPYQDQISDANCTTHPKSYNILNTAIVTLIAPTLSSCKRPITAAHPGVTRQFYFCRFIVQSHILYAFEGVCADYVGYDADVFWVEIQEADAI
jgi:hypothetical protein